MNELRSTASRQSARRSSLSLGLALAFCLQLSSLVACDPRGFFEGRPGRIILISMDTVRADAVTGYGSAQTTPTLAEIAGEGTLFRQAYAASSYTLPSHMSIFTGLDPAEHGVHRMHARLNPLVPTLASLLNDAGYRTQGFHEGIFVAPRYGFDKGFVGYEQMLYPLLSRNGTRNIISWILEAGDDPYFLFLHTYHAHFPYGGYDRYREENPERELPTREELEARAAAKFAGAEDPELLYLCTLYNQLAPRRSNLLGCGVNRPGVEFSHHPEFESDRRAIVRSYEERIGQIDAFIARLRDILKRLGRWDDTLLILTSDHGDAFFEHDLYRHAFVPFDEVLRVPLVFSYPRVLREAGVRRIDGVVSHLDLLPTILGFAGITVPTGLRGSDLGAVMRGDAEIDPRRRVFPGVLRAAQLEQVPLRRVVVGDGHKLIEGHELFGDTEGFLFDIEADPGELENLREARAEEFQSNLVAIRAYTEGLTPVPPVDQKTGVLLPAQDEGPASLDDLSPETQKQLRALGYGD